MTHFRGHQRGGSLGSQGKNKADWTAKQAALLQESEQGMALVIGHPELPMCSSSPPRKGTAEKWGAEGGSTGWS